MQEQRHDGLALRILPIPPIVSDVTSAIQPSQTTCFLNKFECFRYMDQNTSPVLGISDNYKQIEWTPENVYLLRYFYEIAPLSMQCNQSDGTRFPVRPFRVFHDHNVFSQPLLLLYYPVCHVISGSRMGRPADSRSDSAIASLRTTLSHLTLNKLAATRDKTNADMYM